MVVEEHPKICHEDTVVKTNAIDLSRLDHTENWGRHRLKICLELYLDMLAKVQTPLEGTDSID